MRKPTDTILAAIREIQALTGALRVEPNKVPMPRLKNLSKGLKNDDVEKAVEELLESGAIERSECLNYDSYSAKDFKKEKAMEHFENAIREYLDKRAKEDVKFAEKYSDKKKSVAKCCQFILGEIKKLAKGNWYGATDAEVYGLAVHYYDEPDIKVDGNVKADVVINRELTEEEKAAGKQAKENRNADLKEKFEKRNEERRERAEAKAREAEERKRQEAKEKRRRSEEEGLLFLFDEDEL